MGSAPKLIRVTRGDKHKRLREFLVSAEGNDKVHPISGMDELMERRIGKDGDNKNTFAILGTDGLPLAVIYTMWANVAPQAEKHKMLPRSIVEVLEAPVAPIAGTPNRLTCYSVSAFAPGAAQELIKALRHEAIHNLADPLVATFSPFRQFGKFLDGKGLRGDFASASASTQIVIAARHIMNELQSPKVSDKALNLHTKNGASLLDFILKASADGKTEDYSRGANTMTAYLYPNDNDELMANSQVRRKGRIVVSSHLSAAFV